MVRNSYQSALMEHDLLGKHAIDRSSERRFADRRQIRTAFPILEKTTGHPIADFPFGYIFAYLQNLSGTIGKRDQRQFPSAPVVAADNQVIAVVERYGPHANPDLIAF